ncbi:MAG: Transposase [Candidatus Daviesbacteria bacterium GW2011_GWF2_38_7]|nr:MAG: Transposase [Candidatus Daviesbacteria bacterium GW2011_GWF2_38_7]
MNTSLVSSIGIDVSKASLSFATLRVDHSAVVKSCANDEDGVESLLACLKKEKTAITVPCVIESTGDYHLRCALMVSQAGFTVNVINPLITKQYQRASVRNSKDDSVDAVRLARIGLMEPNLKQFKATKQSLALKKIVASAGKLDHYKQQLKAHLKQLEEAEVLLGVKVNLSQLEKTIKSIEKQIDEFETYIHDHAPKEAIEISNGVRGVSQTSVAKVLSLLEGHEFTHKDKLVAFTGLDVAARRSGAWKGRERISKRGNPHFRKLLFQMAWGLKQHNVMYREYYQKMRDAVARKFLRFLFAYVWKKSISFS